MKKKFLYLATITILAVLAAVLLMPGGGQREISAQNLFLPKVAAQINAVDSVEIVIAGNKTVATLRKLDGQWQVEQAHGYLADWPGLRTLLADLAQATVVESKTDKVTYYQHLGVEDVSADGAGGTLVRLGIAGQVTGVLIGKQAQGRPGQYARLQDEARSVLLDRDIDVPSGELDWIDRGIIDIGVAEVAEVEFIHPGGERVLVTKISADQADFELVGLPEGRAIMGSGSINSLGSVLSMLDLDGVRPAAGVDWDGAVRMRLLTFSGMEVMADLLEVSDEYLMRLSASHPASAVAAQASEMEMEGPGQAGLEQAMEMVSEAVDEINKRVSGWVYTIPEYKFEAMTRQPEDLLQPLEAQ